MQGERLLALGTGQGINGGYQKRPLLISFDSGPTVFPMFLSIWTSIVNYNRRLGLALAALSFWYEPDPQDMDSDMLPS